MPMLLLIQVDDLLSSALTDRQVVRTSNHMHIKHVYISGTVLNSQCCRFDVITDKGTLDAVGLMEDALINRWVQNLSFPKRAYFKCECWAQHAQRDISQSAVSTGQSTKPAFGPCCNLGACW